MSKKRRKLGRRHNPALFDQSPTAALLGPLGVLAAIMTKGLEQGAPEDVQGPREEDDVDSKSKDAKIEAGTFVRVNYPGTISHEEVFLVEGITYIEAVQSVRLRTANIELIRPLSSVRVADDVRKGDKVGVGSWAPNGQLLFEEVGKIYKVEDVRSDGFVAIHGHAWIHHDELRHEGHDAAVTEGLAGNPSGDPYVVASPNFLPGQRRTLNAPDPIPDGALGGSPPAGRVGPNYKDGVARARGKAVTLLSRQHAYSVPSWEVATEDGSRWIVPEAWLGLVLLVPPVRGDQADFDAILAQRDEWKRKCEGAEMAAKIHYDAREQACRDRGAAVADREIDRASFERTRELLVNERDAALDKLKRVSTYYVDKLAAEKSRDEWMAEAQRLTEDNVKLKLERIEVARPGLGRRAVRRLLSAFAGVVLFPLEVVLLAHRIFKAQKSAGSLQVSNGGACVITGGQGGGCGPVTFDVRKPALPRLRRASAFLAKAAFVAAALSWGAYVTTHLTTCREPHHKDGVAPVSSSAKRWL